MLPDPDFRSALLLLPLASLFVSNACNTPVESQALSGGLLIHHLKLQIHFPKDVLPDSAIFPDIMHKTGHTSVVLISYALHDFHLHSRLVQFSQALSHRQGPVHRNVRSFQLTYPHRLESDPVTLFSLHQLICNYSLHRPDCAGHLKRPMFSPLQASVTPPGNESREMYEVPDTFLQIQEVLLPPVFRL